MPLSRAEAEQIAALIRRHGSVLAAAKATKTPRQTVQHRVKRVREQWPDLLPESEARAGWAAAGTSAPPAPPEPPTAAERREVLSLREEVARLRKALKEADAGSLALDRVLQAVGYVRGESPPPPDWLLRVPAGGGDDAPGVPILLWSDWHIGETVNPEEIHGVNRFDAEVADTRVRRLVERSLHLSFRHVVAPRYPGAVLILGGDFVSGQLHEELLATDWCPPTVASGWCVSRLRWAIKELRKAFRHLLVVCVPGNHGRLAKKPWAKQAAVACFDHLIYGTLIEMFSDDPGITFVCPPSGEALIQVAGTRYLVMHGHELGVRGGDGIIGALGPMLRGRMKIGGHERSIGRDFDVLVLEHFHQPVWLPNSGLIVNNTLKGFDEYAKREKYRFTPASQHLWFSHPKWGPNLQFEVYLQDPPSRDPVPFAALPVAPVEPAP